MWSTILVQETRGRFSLDAPQFPAQSASLTVQEVEHQPVELLCVRRSEAMTGAFHHLEPTVFEQ